MRRDIVRMAGSLVLAGTLVGLAPMSAAAVTRRVEAGAGGGFRFDPKNRTIARGDRVLWDNVSGFDHDVTSRLPGYFRSRGRLDVGEEYAKTFKAAGTFGYVCVFHAPDMTGKIVVPIRVTLSGGLFTIRVASESSAGTTWRNRVQVRRPGSSTWQTIATTTGTTVTFDPGVHGTYRFRSAVRNRDTGATSGYSPVVAKVY